MKKFSRHFIPFLIVCTLFLGCEKGNNGLSLCAQIDAIRIVPISPVTIGDSVTIKVNNPVANTYVNWVGPNNFSQTSSTIYFSYATLANRGWYYLRVSNSACATKVDSAFLDVKLQQGTPACTITNSTCVYNNLGTDVFGRVTRKFDPTYNFLSLEGDVGPNIKVFFHERYKTIEPEDGIYKTVNIPSFDISDREYNKIFVSTIKQSIYFSSSAGQTAYVSHVNGKLRVQFCDLQMSGTNGSTVFRTLASAHLTAQ